MADSVSFPPLASAGKSLMLRKGKLLLFLLLMFRSFFSFSIRPEALIAGHGSPAPTSLTPAAISQYRHLLHLSISLLSS